MMRLPEDIALVTRPTQLEGLLQRFSTRGQAKFQRKMAKARAMMVAGNIEAAAAAQVAEDSEFVLMESEDDNYQRTVKKLQADLDFGVPLHQVDRAYVPTFDFERCGLVVVVGQDGLVANVAKYAAGIPIVAVNPNPRQFDGVLLPFQLPQVRAAVEKVRAGRYKTKQVTMAQATMQDGQTILAFNDFFIGAKSHISARYRLEADHQSETQSSSGVIVSTGAGSTGWMSSVLNMATGIAKWLGAPLAKSKQTLPWDTDRLLWAVREPFISRTSQAKLVMGTIGQGEELTIESMMAEEGVIFSDGVEPDFIPFLSGSIIRIGIAPQQARLVVPG